jgi:CRP-like cAMP-binding protein
MSSSPGNLLLNSLLPEDLAQILAASESIVLPVRINLYAAHSRPKYAYWLSGGIASLVFNANSGENAEVGIIGREGVVGAMHLLGSLPVQNECFIQIAGAGLRMLFSDLERCFSESPTMHERLLEFAQFTYLNTSVLAACNALHSVEQRLSKWLLVIQDRMQAEGYALTHEFLAEMLVVQRPTLSIVAAALQREGIIHYRHGHLKILKRETLEDRACECYAITRDLLNRLYPSPHVALPALAFGANGSMKAEAHLGKL